MTSASDFYAQAITRRRFGQWGLVAATAGVAGEKMVDLRERIGERLRDAKLRIADAESALVDTTKAAARATDDFVNDNPWQAVGIAAGIGLLLGVIIGRR